MPPLGFEPTISAGERPKTYALDRAATGTGIGSELSQVIGTRCTGFSSYFCDSRNLYWDVITAATKTPRI